MVRPDHHVVIIGGGLGGIGAGILLDRAGYTDFVILERADDIGGTWRDNTYPGIAVDVPAQAYQYSFELNPDWSRVFATGPEVMAYVRRLADGQGVRDRIRCGHEVLSRTWDEANHLWRLATPHGEMTARFVVSAIGAFVDPKPVDIPSIDGFRGKVIRSAAWDHSYDLAGKRVAVIGTGASAVQIIPEIAPIVSHLDVYQRTPIWVGPKPDIVMPKSIRRAFRAFPGAQDAVRRASAWAVETALIGGLLNYDRRPQLSDGAAAFHRRIWYRLQVKDPNLRRRLTPDYGFGCKRPSVSNSYLRTFSRPNVSLITDSIERCTERGLRTTDGVEREVDAIVLATGFRMATDPENYRRTPVRGREGFDLASFYEHERLKSYEGVSLPGLPNHFMIFGPYGWIGGTWHTLVELAAAHALRVISAADRLGATSVEVRNDAAEAWTQHMRDQFQGSLFLSGRCATANSYYFDKRGDVPYLRPTSSATALAATVGFPLDDYQFTGPDGAPRAWDEAQVRAMGAMR